ncbi:hypothetical protein VSH64_45830 [Amycolatopsis rhabdoformis]|uniref:Uncharacterized protein n=1 Tax=Amycolatopsis rhabdoformis TaxID=1448059 RepID=A0ABZ1I6R4_9PSEU|nr:hypothetical protein [Amycolatopsis rhabdoformis]WSE30037.1 hypothetical protein VSH64_45830 [Amycolatopsis rhabdoformis]
MTRSPRGFALPAPARWLLLGVLAFGVLVMHHVPAPHGGAMGGMPMPVASVPLVASGGAIAGPVDETGGHAMLHLCLAVLLTAAGLLLAWAWLRRRREVVVPASVERGLAGFARAPPAPSGRELLTAACVLRI